MAEERALREYVVIMYPTVEDNNFEIKPALI